MKKRADGYLRSSFTFHGKRYYVYGKNKEELFNKEKIKREELEEHYNSRINPSIAEYYQRWRGRRVGTVSESTLRKDDISFNSIAKVKIEDYNKLFRDMLIQDITVDDIYYLQRFLKETKMTKTVNDCIALVKRLLKSAEEERIITYNPGRIIKDLKRVEEEMRDNKHRALSLEEQELFFNDPMVQNSFYYNVYRLAILTGMRVGEIGSLKLSDINVKTGFINVQRTLTYNEKGKVMIGKDAKTKAGKRLIPLTEPIKKVIEDIKQKKKQSNDSIIDFDDVLFRTSSGLLLNAREPDRELKKLCNYLGIEQFTMHGLRATFATRCIESNMNPKTLQEILGHKNFNLTMSLYGHVLEDTKTKEMDKVVINI